MDHRNMICTSQMLDVEMEQQGQSRHSEPYILLDNIPNISHPHIHPMLSASPSTGSLNLHHLPDHHDSRIFYGTHYNSLQNHHPVANLDLGGATSSNFFNPYAGPSSGTGVLPFPLNHASLDHLPSSSNQGFIGLGVDDYDRNNNFMDDFRGPFKRKNAEGIPGNCHHVNGLASSSSSCSGAPSHNGRHQWGPQFESRANVLDAAAFTVPEYGSGTLSIAEEGPHRSVRSRSNDISLMDSTMAHNHNHLIQGNYMGQSFQPASSSWVEQQFGSSNGDGSTSAWNYAPTIPYSHGRSIAGGSLEIGEIGGQRCQESTGNRNSAVFVHSSLHTHHQTHQHLNHHHYPPSMQGMQNPSFNYHPQVSNAYNHPMTNSLHHGTLNSSRDSVEAGTRHPRSFPSSGIRIYRPQRRGVNHATLEDNNRPRLRLLTEDEVAILEIPSFYEVGNYIDHHRDMRLDIDDMSYEELLALEERIGNVNTGLSEVTITKHLKTRIHVPCITYLNLNQSASIDQETEPCSICQVEFENHEEIGILDCGHEYHADCIKKWLQVKNLCPICKKSALVVEGSHG